MGKMLKSRINKRRATTGMRDKYWKEILQLVEKEAWDTLCEYVEKHPWLATSAMGRSILPDYLSAEKDYGLLRLLCNAERVPPAVIDKVIEMGARDVQGRGYLERLLVGHNSGEEYSSIAEEVESPIVAAKVLLTCDNPAAVIEKMQEILEQGLQDDDPGRRRLAERCIGRSQLFFDLLMLLYENEAQHKLNDCLGCDQLLNALNSDKVANYADIESYLEKKDD